MRTGVQSYGRKTGSRLKERAEISPPVEFYTSRSWDEGVTWDDSPTEILSFSERKERIVYENSNRKQFGNCDHVKVWRNIPTGPALLIVPGSRISDEDVWHRWVGKPGYPLGGVPGFIDDWHLDFRVQDPPSFDIPSLLASAHRDMRPKIEQEMSLLNFFLEIDELPDLVLFALKAGKPSLWRKLSHLNFRQISKAIADASLWYGFAVRPTLGDLMALYSVFTDYKRKIDRLIDEQGKPLTRHWSPDTRFQADYLDNSDPYQDRNWRISQRRSEVCGSEFHVTVRYTYEIRDLATGVPLTKEAMYWRGLLDSLGVYRNPQIIWDAIPFSFLVDWVVGVGDWLSGFAKRNLEPTVTLLDCCYSYKQTKTGKWYTRMSSQKYGEDTGTILAGEVTYGQTSYKRVRYCPSPELLQGTPLPDLQSSSWRKWWLGTSLIVSWRL